MEKVWAILCLHRKGFLPPGITLVGGSKDAYFSGVCKVLFNIRRYYHSRILKLLFCCFSNEDDRSRVVHRTVIPRRYDSYFAKPATLFSDAQLLALILNESHFYPKSLHCNKHTAFHNWEGTENYDLLAACLKEVCNLHLTQVSSS